MKSGLRRTKYEKDHECICWYGFVDDLLFSPQASAAYDDLHEGYATYTGSGYSGGAFLLDPIPSDMEITAINPADLNYGGVKAALAGSYLEVEGPKGKQPYMLLIFIPKALGELLICHLMPSVKSAI